VPRRGVNPEGEERLDQSDLRDPLLSNRWRVEDTDYFPGEPELSTGRAIRALSAGQGITEPSGRF